MPWATLRHAHGEASDIPELIRALADPYGDWEQTLDELLGDDLLHQGSCYSATAPAMPFLARMVTSGALPAKQRLDLYAWLILAAGRWADGLITDADRAFVAGAPPQSAAWARDVRVAIDAEIPGLLGGWELEPAAGRVALAVLAALFPHHAQPLTEHVGALAASFDGTRAGAHLGVARGLVRHSDDEALAAAAGIVAWEDGHNPDWLTAPGLPAALKAQHILAEGALRVLSRAVGCRGSCRVAAGR